MLLTKAWGWRGGARCKASERMGRGYIRFQKPFSLLSRGLGPCPSVIKVALNEAWHIQGKGGGAALNGEGPREAPWLQWGGFPASWGRRGPSGTRPAAAPLPSASASLPPGLGLLANEKEEKNLLCIKAKLGEREGKGKKKKKKKKDNTWVVCLGDF